MKLPRNGKCLLDWALAFGFLLATTVCPRAEEWKVSGKLVGKNDKKAEDISGIACSGALGYPRECLVIDDETQFAQWATLSEPGKLIAGDLLPLIDDTFKGKPLELDGEGAAYADGSFFVIGSFGSARSADETPEDKDAARLKADSHVFRITHSAAGLSVTESNAPRALILADPELRPFADQPLSSNGLTIEGIAVIADTAYIGFRGPVLEGNERAAILELPTSLLFGEANGTATTHLLALGPGRGIRDLTSVGEDLLILAGPGPDTTAGDAEPDAYALYRWTSRSTDEPDRVFTIPTFRHGKDQIPDKPEAILPLAISGGDLTVLLMFDGPEEGAPRDFTFAWK